MYLDQNYKEISIWKHPLRIKFFSLIQFYAMVLLCNSEDLYGDASLDIGAPLGAVYISLEGLCVVSFKASEECLLQLLSIKVIFLQQLGYCKSIYG